jgi:hypothetical protein
LIRFFCITKHFILISQNRFQKANCSSCKKQYSIFAEGGDLIEGIESKVAFKAIHYDTKPADVKGFVTDSKGEQVAEIRSVHDGMGFFSLEPRAGETYTAKWKDEEGNSYQTALPAAKKTGAALQVQVQNNSRSFRITRSENATGNFGKLYIVATMQQNVVYMAGVDLSQSFVTGGSIPVAELPSGILQVSLFDSNWLPLQNVSRSLIMVTISLNLRLGSLN